MTIPAPTLDNLGLYVLQAALLIGALALMIAALRPGPTLRLAACRALLALLFVLPLQVWLRSTPALAGLPRATASSEAVAADAIQAHGGSGTPWATVIAAVIAAGVVARLLWLAAGLVRLRRLARDLPDPGSAGIEAEIADLQGALDTRARVAFVDRVAQPVTFGIAPAVVLLPAALLAASAERRRAIVCHELLHVRRRDWLWVIGEELALTILWFHPAAWWLVGELQLAREQVVDHLTVAATGARREYMDALFSAADLPSAPPLLSGFLRRRHLARRLVSLAEEVVMSRVRLMVGAVAMVAVLFGSAAVGLAAWPLAPMRSGARPASTAFVARDEVVQIGRRVDVAFPESALAGGLAEVLVDVEVQIDAAGSVTSARAATIAVLGGERGTASVSVPSDIDSMVAATVDAMNGWRFRAPEVAPAKLIVGIRFAAETRQAIVTRISAPAGYRTKPILEAGGRIKAPTKVYNVQPVYPQEAKDQMVQGVVTLDVIIAEDGSVKEVSVLRSVPQLDAAAIDAVKQWRYEPTLLNGVAVPIRCTATVSFTLGQ